MKIKNIHLLDWYLLFRIWRNPFVVLELLLGRFILN